MADPPDKRRRVHFSEQPAQVFTYERPAEMEVDASAVAASQPLSNFMWGDFIGEDEDDDDLEDDDEAFGPGVILPTEYSDSDSDEDGDGGLDDEDEEDTTGGRKGSRRGSGGSSRSLQAILDEDEDDAPLMDEPDSDHETQDPIDLANLPDDALISRDDMRQRRAAVRVPSLPTARDDHWLQRSLGHESPSLVTAADARPHAAAADPATPFQLSAGGGAFANRAAAVFGGLDAHAPHRVPEPPVQLPPAEAQRPAAPAKTRRPPPGFVREPGKWTHYSLADTPDISAASQQASALDFLKDLRARREAEAATAVTSPARPEYMRPTTAVVQTVGQLRVLPAVEVGAAAPSKPRAHSAPVAAGKTAVALGHLGDETADVADEAAAPPETAPPAIRRKAHRPSGLRMPHRSSPADAGNDDEMV